MDSEDEFRDHKEHAGLFSISKKAIYEKNDNSNK